MVYIEEHGHCDICGNDNIYVAHHYEMDENDEIINSKMVCVECNNKRMSLGLPDNIWNFKLV